MFIDSYGNVFTATTDWQELDVPAGELFAWNGSRPTSPSRPYFDGMPTRARAAPDIAAPACSRCSATR